MYLLDKAGDKLIQQGNTSYCILHLLHHTAFIKSFHCLDNSIPDHIFDIAPMTVSYYKFQVGIIWVAKNLWDNNFQ